MAIIEVKQVEYKIKRSYGEETEIRWRVTFGGHVIGVFTQEDSANKFVNTPLFQEVIKHFKEPEEQESSEDDQISYCSVAMGGTD